jgi:hypothetical protein
MAFVDWGANKLFSLDDMGEENAPSNGFQSKARLQPGSRHEQSSSAGHSDKRNAHADKLIDMTTAKTYTPEDLSPQRRSRTLAPGILR